MATIKKTTNKKKIGRPKAENPLNEVQCFRMTEKEYTLFEMLCSLTGNNSNIMCRKIMGMGFLSTYMLYFLTKKQKDLVAINTKQILMSWVSDPTAAVPRTVFDEIMNSPEFPKELKMLILQLMD